MDFFWIPGVVFPSQQTRASPAASAFQRGDRGADFSLGPVFAQTWCLGGRANLGTLCTEKSDKVRHVRGCTLFRANSGISIPMGSSTPTLSRCAARFGAVALALGSLSGCQSIDVNSSNAAQLRMIAASPDAPGLDFYENNNAALAYNLGFGTVTSYVALAPGNYSIAADSAGTRTTLVSANATLATQKTYTALIGNVDANLQETILQDQNQPAPSGEIAVRFVDQATKVGAVDVYLIPSGGSLTTTAALVTNLNFQGNTGYLNIPAGTYAIAVVPTGTVPVATTTTLLTGAQVGYAAGAVRTVVFIDVKVTTTPGVQAVVADDYDTASGG